jgi:FdhD protein
MDATTATRVLPAARIRDGKIQQCDDCFVVEEPLEIRINGKRFTATMRTPGNDELLARGLLFSESVIEDNDEIIAIKASTLCRELTNELVNLVDVTLERDDEIPSHLWERALISNASCGLCGKASIEALQARVLPLPDGELIEATKLFQLPELLQAKQALFEKTGGLHAAGIFRIHKNKIETLAVFEDIGRHNATDKAIGFGLENGWLPAAANASGVLALLVSGRASFEIVQKALVARIPILCSVSAASSLAIELASANNQTLVGFLRGSGLSVYCGAQRIGVKPFAEHFEEKING